MKTLFGYTALALVISVSSALLVVVARRAPARVRLFLRCLRWGAATGAVTGGVVGAMVLLLSAIGSEQAPWLVRLTPAGALYGAVIGVIVSLIPSLIGAAVIAETVGQRHPHPSSEESVERHLTAIFRGVVGLLDAALLIAVIAGGASLSDLGTALPFFVAGNACVVLMLCRAKGSIGRLWTAAARFS